ncbi:hypothetical protein [Prevotella sp. MA2016]|uniref:hypothetical protein n=1 Tax=Prevotella sp. MA2016 TaxID=1408310 RepID=UPI00048B8823|nr:hypothetical protein [Prevotella sp. MA2016]
MKKIARCYLFMFIATLITAMMFSCSKGDDSDKSYIEDYPNQFYVPYSEFCNVLIGRWSLYSAYRENSNETILVDNITDETEIETWGEIEFLTDGSFKRGVSNHNWKYSVENYDKMGGDVIFFYAIRITDPNSADFNVLIPVVYLDQNTLRWENTTGYYVYKKIK